MVNDRLTVLFWLHKPSFQGASMRLTRNISHLLHSVECYIDLAALVCSILDFGLTRGKRRGKETEKLEGLVDKGKEKCARLFSECRWLMLSSSGIRF